MYTVKKYSVVDLTNRVLLFLLTLFEIRYYKLASVYSDVLKTNIVIKFLLL